MTRYLTRDRIAIGAALAAPLAVAAVLLPFRASWPDTNVALLLVVVVVVVGVAVAGNRVAGGLAAVVAAAWFDFFFTVPYYRFTIRSPADVTTAVLLLFTGLVVSQLAARARRLKVVASRMRVTSRRSTRLLRWRSQPRSPKSWSIMSGSSSPACWIWTEHASSTGPCWATRRAWSQTGP